MQKNTQERLSVILAALLHDIGKFVQRAQKNPKEQKHTYWGQEWIINNLSEKLISVLDNDCKQQIITMVNCHHDDENYISIADRYSAGMERTPKEMEDDEEKNDPFTSRMKSIFSLIHINANPSLNSNNNTMRETRKIYYELNYLKDLNNIQLIESKHCNHEEYQTLLTECENEIKNLNFIQNSDYQIVVEKLYYLLMKYTWCIPSAAYESEPDISLFEHLKTTAAIATCLYDLKDQTDKKFILLAGDISGIQDFIYSVTSKKALKGLRGRSFYLQLLSETIARKILDEFDLTICNLLFCGGGNFTLLLPKTNNAEEKIKNLRKEIDTILFKAHNGKLALNIAYIELEPSDFKIESFSDKIKQLSEKLAQQKRKKFSDIITSEFFEPYPKKIEKELKGCEICGKEIEDTNEFCDLCKSFIDLSNDLSNAKVITLEKIKSSEINKEVSNWKDIFRSFGYEWTFIGENQDITRLGNLNNFVYLLNSTEFLQNNCTGFRFEAVYIPKDDNKEVLTLDKLAEKSNSNFKRWAALRMDVDNLGKIFTEGLQQKTISRYSMLSFMFSLFFSMGVKEIVENNYKNCCIVYSGGDDLFILGPWSDLPYLAQDIYNKFREYVGYHPITLSAGIYIAPSDGFPVYQAAKEAGEAEEKSKKGEKNSITFLDKTVQWNKFDDIKKVCETIVEILNKGVARSLLTILYAGYQDINLFKEKKIPMVRIWRLFYAIKRLMERHKDFASELEDLRQKFITDFELMPELDLAVRWAELLTRKEVKK
jgi:CRISPR-associated protein Csm1